MSGFNSRPSCDGRLDVGALALVGGFQFTPVVRRATKSQNSPSSPRSFNSRPSCDGRRARGGCSPSLAVSIHARRATGDASVPAPLRRARRFNSRPSCDGRPKLHQEHLTRFWFQFTPVVRRATRRGAWRPRFAAVSIHARRATGDLLPTDLGSAEIRVSIHARRATGDHQRPHKRPAPPPVSIHARRATGDEPTFRINGTVATFQFTPVVRRATILRQAQTTERGFQFTPVVRRATPKRLPPKKPLPFQFTPVVRRATPRLLLRKSVVTRFNSRPSCDGRR